MLNGRLKELTPQNKINSTNAKSTPENSNFHDDWVGFAKISSMVFCRSIIFYGLLAFIPLFFINIYAFSEASANMNLTIFSLVGMVATLLGGRFADEFGLYRVIKVSFLCLVVFLFLLVEVRSEVVAILMVMLVGFVMNSSYSSIIALGQSHLPNHIGFASGILFGLALSVGGLFAPLIGRIGDKYGLMGAMHTILGVCVVAFLLTFIIPKTNPASLKNRDKSL